MNYLLDRKTKRRRFFYPAFFVVLLLFVFYFRSGIFEKLSYLTHVVFRPVLVVGGKTGDKLGGIGAFFSSRASLEQENENLKTELQRSKMAMANYDSILAENISLKEILGRKTENRNMVLAAILSKPNRSPYDTLVIDSGAEDRLEPGDMVFAYGNVPIGKIAEVYPNSSKVVLLSNEGERTQVVISSSDIFLEIIGRNGGNFEMTVPKDFLLQKGDQAVLPGIVPYVVGIVETIISDPRDALQKAYLVSPVNIQELKFVEVER